MAENKDTYVLTIENDAINTTITSVQKNNELLKNNLNINLEDVDRASAELKNVINPAITPVASEPQPELVVTAEEPKSELVVEQEEPQPEVVVAEETQPEVAAAAEPVPESDLTNDINVTVTNKKNEVKFQDNVGNLLNQIESSNSIRDKKRLKNYITNTINNPETSNERKNMLINNYFKQTNAKFENNQLTGGTHHTIKRRHNRRNIKSTTRKGQLYRKNHRRTHGRKAGNGKKQTRRIVNH